MLLLRLLAGGLLGGLAGGLFSGAALGLELSDLLVDLLLQRLLGGLGLSICGLVGLNVGLEALDERLGLGNLRHEIGLARLELALLGLFLGLGGLERLLGLLDLGSGVHHGLLQRLVIAHDLADHVDAREQVGDAAALKQDDDEGELAALFHLAHAHAEELGLLGLLGLRLDQLRLLFEDQLAV